MFVTIKVGSITNAQRAAKALRMRGYRPTVDRLSNPQTTDGCGYVIKVATDDKNKVIRILNSSGVHILGVED